VKAVKAMGHAHPIHKIGGSFLEGIGEGLFHATAERLPYCAATHLTTRTGEEFTAYESVMENIECF
jgi:hypothetical protein